MATQRLILVDGSSLIYRALFAIPAALRTSTGLPTNAVLGFVQMFRKLLSGRSPTFGAVVFDAPGKTFRTPKHPDYKAQRPPMPDELLFEAPDAEVDTAIEIVQRHMVRPCALKVPLKVDIGAGRS
mgnify:CR=1 FL=1